jgi:hypothetical protein
MGEIVVARRLHSIWQSSASFKKNTPDSFSERIYAPADSFISKNEGMNEVDGGFLDHLIQLSGAEVHVHGSLG